MMRPKRTSRRSHSLGEAFTVTLARTGRCIHVGPRQSILQALEANGIQVPSDCRFGICGTCRTDVLGGAVMHRDMCLDDRTRRTSMAICVSRADVSTGVTLDL